MCRITWNLCFTALNGPGDSDLSRSGPPRCSSDQPQLCSGHRPCLSSCNRFRPLALLEHEGKVPATSLMPTLPHERLLRSGSWHPQFAHVRPDSDTLLPLGHCCLQGCVHRGKSHALLHAIGAVVASHSRALSVFVAASHSHRRLATRADAV
jgi:hypothetical protein